MSEFIFFIIGIMLGGLTGVAIMCCLQMLFIKRKNKDDPQEIMWQGKQLMKRLQNPTR